MVNQPATEPMSLIQPIDRDELRQRVRSATPVPNFLIDNFLDESFAEEVLAAFPTFEQAASMGRTFKAVNEKNKIQVTDASKFPEAIARLDRELSSPAFLDLLSYVFEMPGLHADPNHVGGGMHQTGARGHLDVHVDFNYDETLQMHRRLNILVYFNKDWDPARGGDIELWDKDVKTCVQRFSPIFNRCVVFATSDLSYHGVTAVR
ncbi:MAG: 2OG-Fe(II) oxygenase, partial [Isosphaeraceae bacterium]